MKWGKIWDLISFHLLLLLKTWPHYFHDNCQWALPVSLLIMFKWATQPTAYKHNTVVVRHDKQQLSYQIGTLFNVFVSRELQWIECIQLITKLFWLSTCANSINITYSCGWALDCNNWATEASGLTLGKMLGFVPHLYWVQNDCEQGSVSFLVLKLRM